MSGKNEKIGGGGFHHISMKVRDFEATLKFYTEALGFEAKRVWKRGDIGGALLDTGDGNYLEISGGRTDDAQTGNLILHFALRTEDCDEAIERARAAGAEVTVEPKDVEIPSDPPVAARIAFFKGPDGESIEFFQNEST